MAQRLIFQATSPLGYRVSLTRDRWREIIRYKHPALAGHERELRSCVEAPTLIRQSDKDPNVHLYYAPVRPRPTMRCRGPGERKRTIRGDGLLYQEHQERH